MDPQRVRRIAELFEQAVDLPPGDRTRFLQTQCQGDGNLLAEVEETLRHDRAAGRFLEGLPQPPADTEHPPHEFTVAVPDQIGGFRILRKIGEGGMGAVYEASQERLGRPVALKILKSSLVSAGTLRRFEYEAQLLARLRHPGIAQIYEAGVYETRAGPLPFFAMEYIAQALPITEHAAAHGLDTHGRLDFFTRVCDAVHHGHQKGVIHRDLKPSNILVDAAGQPKVIDFGVACCVDPDAALTTMQTTVGQIVGTVQYMSPEQCAANPADVDTRSDVYSLGVVLFELITGRMPYDVRGASVFETLRAVREAPLPRLSAIDRRLRGDVETIVRKALEKDRSRRYQSAAELGEDIRRFLRKEPITARLPTMMYQLRSFARRNRALVSGVVSVFVVLVAGIVATTRQTMHANSARVEAERQRARAERQAYAASIYAADAAVSANDGGAAMQRLRSAPEALRNWESRYLSRCADQSLALFRGVDDHRIISMAFSPDGRFVSGVSFNEDVRSRLHIWDRSTGRRVNEVDGDVGAYVCYTFTADGSLVVAQGDHQLASFEVGTNAVARRRKMPNAIKGYRPTVMSGSLLIQGWSYDAAISSIGFWTGDGGPVRGTLQLGAGLWFSAGAVSDNGQLVAVGQNDGVVLVCNTVPGAPPTRIPALTSAVHGLALTADARYLAASGEDGIVKVWELSAPPKANPDVRTAQAPINFRLIASLRGSSQRASCVAFSPNGQWLAVGSADKAVRVWHIADGQLISTLLGNAAPITSVAFSGDARFLASGARDATARLWDLSTPKALVTRNDMPGLVSAVAFNAKGNRLAINVSNSCPMVLDPVAAETIVAFQGLPPASDRAVFNRSGNHLTLLFKDGTIRSIDVPSRHEIFRIETHSTAVLPLALSPDESQLAWADDRIHIFDIGSRSESGTLGTQGSKIYALAYSPDGRVLVSGDDSGMLAMWKSTGALSIRAQRHRSCINWIAYSANGRFLATASEDGTVQLCDPSSLRVLRTLRPEIGDIWCVAFSPDGSRLVAGGRDRTVRLFDVETGGEVLVLRGPTGTVMSVAFSPDGRRIAAGSWAKEVFIWDSGPADSTVSMARGTQVP